MDIDELTERLRAYIVEQDWTGAVRLLSRQINDSKTADARWRIGTALLRAMNPHRYYTQIRPKIGRHSVADPWPRVTDAMSAAYRKRDCHRVPTAVTTGLCHVTHYLRDSKCRWSKNTTLGAVGAVSDWIKAHE